VVYRYGGEELLVVFPGQTLDTAVIGTERMRAKVESLAKPHPGLEAGAVVTVSAGVAVFQLNLGDGVHALLNRADAALYEAKEAGRNRVVTSGPRPYAASR
jgi:diguanylate cyclase (GGDEF)-like protein